MPAKKKAEEAPVYVAPKIVFVATAHHQFSLLGGHTYHADGNGFVWGVPPEHFGPMINAGAIPMVINYDEVLETAAEPDEYENVSYEHMGKFTDENSVHKFTDADVDNLTREDIGRFTLDDLRAVKAARAVAKTVGEKEAKVAEQDHAKAAQARADASAVGAGAKEAKAAEKAEAKARASDDKVTEAKADAKAKLADDKDKLEKADAKADKAETKAEAKAAKPLEGGKFPGMSGDK